MLAKYISGKLIFFILSVSLISNLSLNNVVYSNNYHSKGLEASLGNQISHFLSSLKVITSDFIQTSNHGDIYSGKFWLQKKNGKTNVRVKYEEGLNQDIFIIDNIVNIHNNNTSKVYKYSLSQTPIYSILVGKIDLSKEKISIIEDSSTILRVKLNRSSLFNGVSVTLIFSKYESTNNLKSLDAWIIDDGKTETLFSFDPQSLHINDPNKIPQNIFMMTN